MSRPDPSPSTGAPDDVNTSPRLDAYLARTRIPLDLFALCTLWIIAVPIRSFGEGTGMTIGGLLLRLSISVVFAADMAVRCALAPNSLAYLRSHPLGLLAVILPPVRVVFSLRLITSLFRRGHIERFLGAATALLFNGVLIVFFYERGAPDANITTLGGAIWWAIVTVSTVGYGDLYPVTLGGRVVAGAIMAIGILTLAVVTAQVSSSFVDQAARRRPETPVPPDPPLDLRALADLHERLDRIEARLAAAAGDEGSSGRHGPGDRGGPAA